MTGCQHKTNNVFDQYAPAKVNPSKKANVCTHKPEFSADNAKVTKCDLIKVKDGCEKDTDCVWTSGFGLVSTGVCLEKIKEFDDHIKAFNDPKQKTVPRTVEYCNSACTSSPKRDCIGFNFGKKYKGALNGICVLLT